MKKEDQVLDELVKHFRFTKSTTLQTSINRDLKLVGIDAYQFIEDISKMYQVDFSNIDMDKYFLGEESFPYNILPKKWFGKSDYIPPIITLSHIVKVIENGKWFDPE